MADLAQPSINAGARRFLARWDRRFHNLQSRVVRYGLAIVSVTVALGLSLALQYYQFRGVEVPVLTLAIAVTTWYAGNGPAVAAIILSSLCFDYFFTEPYYSFRNYQQRPALLFHFRDLGTHLCRLQRGSAPR
jgi:K+-sensing histidine kinase KdpD